MTLNESSENYLEMILMLSKKLPVVRSVDIAENMGVLAEKLLKIWVSFLFSAIFGGLRKDLFCGEFPGGSAGIKHSHPETHRPRMEWQRGVFNL